MEKSMLAFDDQKDIINLEAATELRLGLPGTDDDKSEKKQSTTPPAGVKSNKRALPDINQDFGESTDDLINSNNIVSSKSKLCDQETSFPPSKAQVVGWPPIRSYRKNCLQAKKSITATEASGMYVKVSMDGAPYLRKIDLTMYKAYPQLLQALEDMFKFKVGEYSQREGYNGSEFVPTYEDKDGDWMLVGDVPWDMFITSCKRLRIVKGSEARGLGCAV